MSDDRGRLRDAGVAQVHVIAAEAETIERITDLISGRHPSTTPALCRTDDTLIKVTFYTDTRITTGRPGAEPGSDGTETAARKERCPGE